MCCSVGKIVLPDPKSDDPPLADANTNRQPPLAVENNGKSNSNSEKNGNTAVNLTVSTAAVKTTVKKTRRNYWRTMFWCGDANASNEKRRKSNGKGNGKEDGNMVVMTGDGGAVSAPPPAAVNTHGQKTGRCDLNGGTFDWLFCFWDDRGGWGGDCFCCDSDCGGCDCGGCDCGGD